MRSVIQRGDCIELMKQLPDESIDMILCDLPYGTSAHKWDEVIPLDKMWEQYERIISKNGAIVLFATQPFTASLITSNLKLYRYSWIWKKDGANGFLNANYAPLKVTEDICVFSKGKVGSLSKNKIVYNPQGIKEVNIEKRNNPNSTYRKSQGYNSMGNMLNNGKQYVQKYTGYPTNILEFSREKNAVHPTQKPIELLEYLIKTYTYKGDVVLDNCMGSGSTGVACVNTNRNFVGFEIDVQYFHIAKERINIAKEKQIEFLQDV